MTPRVERRGGKFRYLYRVIESNHPHVPIGTLLIDKGRAMSRSWEFTDTALGKQWQVTGKRLNRLCPECHNDYWRATQIGHYGPCGPDVPPVDPGVIPPRRSHHAREMARHDTH